MRPIEITICRENCTRYTIYSRKIQVTNLIANWITVKIKLRNFWVNLLSLLLVLVKLEPTREKIFFDGLNLFSIIITKMLT